jgi:diguanylate cyclase (GGDEF)-like protein
MVDMSLPTEQADGRRPGRDHRRRLDGARLLYAALGVVLAAYIALLIIRPAGRSSTLIDGWGVDLFELLGGGLCIVGGRRRQPGSAVPLVLGAALIAWAFGDVALTIESLGGATPPTPSVADALYLTFFPLSYVAVVLMIRGETRRLSSPNWLDGAVAGLGCGAVCAAFAFSAIVHTTDSSPLGAAVNLAYPVGDVLLLLLVSGGTAVMSGRRKAPWLLLAAGLSVNVLGDTANLFSSSVGGSHVGVAINAAAWPTSTLMLSAAMWIRPGLANLLAEQRTPGFVLPGAAAMAGLVILLLGTFEHVNHVATSLAALTLLAVVARTWASVRTLRAQTRRRHEQAVTDHLTGLANRRRLFTTLDAFFAQPVSDRPALSFLFIDLNGFKRINDSFGHPVGDDVLGRVGARLARALRPGDLLARVGGDEFAVVLLGADRQEAASIAAQLNASLDEPFLIDAVHARIGASIGVALMPGDAEGAEELMGCADAAMYRAKLAGERCAFYDHELDRGGDRLQLADDLSAAIDGDELVLHYQPQLDLVTGQIATVEALVRWNHPEFGMMPPLKFLPLAEEAGLMGRLTVWVLGRALAQCAAWHAAGRPLRVSVNISVSDLLDPSFPATVSSLLADARLAPAALTIEITETSIIDEFERAREAVATLHGLGVRLSIDDFGAGFTSLAYLNELAVEELKLDRRFIAPLAGGVRSRESELVRATIELGHALGLQVIAEGIEDGNALELLRELGCDIGQGYGIGRPVPAAQLVLDPRPAPAASATAAV